MSNNQSAYMLETASNYLRAARLLWNQPNLSRVAVVNAALAIEIILKSFIAQPSNNSRKGTVAEQYEIKSKRLHTLTALARAIEPQLYEKLGFEKYDYWFKEFDNLFVESRYPYEQSSNVGLSDIPIHIGINMFRSTIAWYKESGNPDPWVVMYPDVVGGGL